MHATVARLSLLADGQTNKDYLNYTSLFPFHSYMIIINYTSHACAQRSSLIKNIFLIGLLDTREGTYVSSYMITNYRTEESCDALKPTIYWSKWLVVINLAQKETLHWWLKQNIFSHQNNKKLKHKVQFLYIFTTILHVMGDRMMLVHHMPKAM